MSNTSSPFKIGRWIAAGIGLLVLCLMFFHLVKDNMPKAEVRKIEGYTPWSDEALRVAETIPIQNGGRIKPFATYAGFTMLSLHGARSMKVEDSNGKKYSIKPTAWMMDSLFRPQLAVNLPTFRIENSAIIEAIGLKTLNKRDRYSYTDIEPGRDKLIELGQAYEKIEKDKRDPTQNQTVLLAYNMREYESLLGYFGFARMGITLHGSGKDGAADQRTDLSLLMATAPQIRQQISLAQAQGSEIPTHLKSLLEQVLDGANFAKFGLYIFPPADRKETIWQAAGNSIMGVFTEDQSDPSQAIKDIKALESVARSVADEPAFLKQMTSLRDDLAKRAKDRGEYSHIELEAKYYRQNGFLYAMVFFIMGTIGALAMWALGRGLAGKMSSWATLGLTASGLVCCVIAIVQRCIIMQRPPIGNLYDTIIFIATTVVILAFLIEWMTRRRFALGIAPILGALLIILARRYELGDAKDHMDPLVAVLDSNYWLTIHVITITLGYAAGLLSAFLACVYLLIRGLALYDDDQDVRRSLTRVVYGMICLTLFLSLVGTVLGGIWANDSWGRFWGWDPKENGALLIVLWTLSILHARLGGYIREWGLHLAAVFTAVVVAFSWWHVNFLGVGLHNYGFTAGKETIWVFYIFIAVVMMLGFMAMWLEKNAKASRDAIRKLGTAN